MQNLWCLRPSGEYDKRCREAIAYGRFHSRIIRSTHLFVDDFDSICAQRTKDSVSECVQGRWQQTLASGEYRDLVSIGKRMAQRAGDLSTSHAAADHSDGGHVCCIRESLISLNEALGGADRNDMLRFAQNSVGPDLGADIDGKKVIVDDFTAAQSNASGISIDTVGMSAPKCRARCHS